MVDYLIMFAILIFLAFDLLFKVKRKETTTHFFDLDNTIALRGFWCIVVVLVHIPLLYQNRIQDMIGSFGYIGITFFFMASGYGLTLKNNKQPESIKDFWRQRLPKLLITGWVISIVSKAIYVVVLKEKCSLISFFHIHGWIKWLIVCYFFFWISHRIKYTLKRKVLRRSICTALVIIFSIVTYVLKNKGIIDQTIWPTECYGFIWGMLLCDYREVFVELFNKKWARKIIGVMVIAVLLGVSYLKLKPVIFLGDYCLKIVLGLAITVLILVSNIRLSYGNAVSMFLGRISFEIYLVHGAVIHILQGLLPKLSSGVFILLTLIVTVGMAFVLHILATRIVKLFYKIPIMNKTY